MTQISRFQFNKIVSAGLIAAALMFWPKTDLGQNVPNDTSYTTMRVYNDRALAAGIYNTAGNALLPTGSRDTNGMPTTAFSIKVCEGSAGQYAFDPSVTGTWYIEYQWPTQAVIDYVNGNTGTTTSHTFSGGVGKVQISYAAGSGALMPRFDRGVTSIKVFDPTTSAAAIAGGGASVPMFNAQYLRTFNPYAYGRMMDISAVNGDYVNQTNPSSPNWPTVVNWADRRTPTNYHFNDLPGLMAGIPLEWQVGLCNTAGKSGWFNISELASDDHITQFATYVAQNLSAGTWAAFELGNERWNTGGGFFCYRKAGYAAAVECNASQPAKSFLPAALTSFASDGTTATVVFASGHGLGAGQTQVPFPVSLASGYSGFAATGPFTYVNPTTITYPCTQASTGGAVAASTVLNPTGWLAIPISEWYTSMYSLCPVSFSCDGTTMTVGFNQAHGATTGQTPKLLGFNSGYGTYAPTSGATLTVVNSTTISYPCTTVTTGSPVPASTVLANSGILMLNATAPLMATGVISSIYDLSFYWHIRRAFQMAKLVRDAFTAVGRQLSDCKPVLALQAGTHYAYGNWYVDKFVTAYFGATLSSRLTAVAFGGYFGAEQTVLNPGFGYTKHSNDASLTTEAAVNTQMQQVVDSCLGAYCYFSTAAWAKDQGVELWGYEIGMDLTNASGESTTTRSAKDAYQVDYATYGPNITAMTLKWLRNLQAIGFKKFGWYQCGAGTQAGYGGFNLGQTPNEIDYTTATSGQSPKFQGMVASLQPPTTPYANHAFPCTLSGWDCIGNEAVKTTAGVWPALNGTNLPYNYLGYVGPNSNGQAYYVWSESTQTATVTIVGDYTSGPAQTLVVKPLGGVAVNMSVGASPIAAAQLGTCQITLQPGMNYVFVSSANYAPYTFIHSIQFS